MQYLWLPLAIPLLQAIVVLLWQSAIYLLGLRRISSSNLPKSIIDRIIRNGGKIDVDGVIMPGVCLATDIEGYTTITAAIGPRKTTQLINDYSEVIYPIITRKKGLMLNNVADSIVAVWTSTKIDKKLRLDACHAALELKAAVNNFNKNSQYPLRTRIGLHYGEMDMSFVGADNNYTFRAVGDTVNTANRIEQLNKELGTRILASEPVLESLPGLLSREVGAFLLKGKAHPVTVFELMGTDETDQTRQQLASAFGNAITLFKNRQWQRAWAEFLAIYKEYPDDGPTLFYINYLQNNLPLMPEVSSKEYTVFIDVGNITNLLH
jgi:adenylate cyclase